MPLKLAKEKAVIARDANGLGFVVLNLADVWFTKAALSLGAEEINPIMAFLTEHMEAKVLASIIVVFALWYLSRDKLITLLNIGMSMIVLWNASVVLRIIL